MDLEAGRPRTRNVLRRTNHLWILPMSRLWFQRSTRNWCWRSSTRSRPTRPPWKTLGKQVPMNPQSVWTESNVATRALKSAIYSDGIRWLKSVNETALRYFLKCLIVKRKVQPRMLLIKTYIPAPALLGLFLFMKKTWPSCIIDADEAGRREPYRSTLCVGNLSKQSFRILCRPNHPLENS